MNITRAQQTILPSLPFNPLSVPPSFSKLKQPNSFLLSAYSKRLKLLKWIVRTETNQSTVPISSENGKGPSYQADVATRPPFDINLAVVLAGFAFEAYTSPPEKFGWREMDSVDCETVFLSEEFLSEIYDGQLFVKVKKGLNLPIMDPWGTSDPYVVLQMDGQVAKTKIKWANKEPVWNEDLTLNINKSRTKFLQVEAWDANLITPHKCMGKTSINLESLCDGELHELAVELDASSTGSKIQLEVRYKTFEEIERDKQWWRIPFVSDLLFKSSFGAALRTALGSESINVTQFVQSAFGQLNSLAFSYLPKPPQIPQNTPPISQNTPENSQNTPENSENIILENSETIEEKIENSEVVEKSEGKIEKSDESFWKAFSRVINQNSPNIPENSQNIPKNSENSQKSEAKVENGEKTVKSEIIEKSEGSDEYFWKTFSGVINQTVNQRLGLSLPEIKIFEGFELLNSIGSQSRQIAEKEYVESGLASSEILEDQTEENNEKIEKIEEKNPAFLDIKKVSLDVVTQTETLFGALIFLAASISQNREENSDSIKNEEESNKQEEIKVLSEEEKVVSGDIEKEGGMDAKKKEEMKKLFSKAESAMEAWAMLATSLGRPSFIKSDFVKICFLDNISTDTQVAIWRDSLRRRIVVAFRGTEQSKWKDLQTDLLLLPARLNPERLGGDIKEEVQVHSGFLNAYDSVRTRILTLLKFAIGYNDKDDITSLPLWHVYITGHSLGGALATLLALELSSSQMAKKGVINVTMYNFGSPRVGNRRFAQVYNSKVKDSWRIVNHRDIIPTVPRLMGYCHVAEPVYLGAGSLKEALKNQEIKEDGYQGDVIGESTPDALVSEFLKGEMQLVEKILQTEINLLLSIRDGSALMQHMEDFYYVTLLESVRSNHQTASEAKSKDA
ncbi:hypothetical protein LUZ60_016278 [Juncus effusus]|nr:hypothetical protein LUZ60_016278 [Juncus effusus]